MFIQDIEFIDPLSQKDLTSDLTVKGGASAVAIVEADTDGGNVVYAVAGAKATGDYSTAIAGTKAKLGKRSTKSKKGYTAGYTTGYTAAYGVAYGVDRYNSVVKDVDAIFAAF